MKSCPCSRAGRGLLITLLGLIILACAAPSQASVLLYWLPAEFAQEVPSAGMDLYFDGASGRLVVPQGPPPALLDAHAMRLEVSSLDDLYVFWVADAGLADFEAPARVLAAGGHEVLLECPGGTPHLTAAAAAQLPGLKQPVKVSTHALPWPTTSVLPVTGSGPGASDREADPLIEQMLAALTQANYMSTWQELEDFVTRYTLSAQNEAAAQWILAQFQSFGLDAELHSYNQSGIRHNIVATLPGLVDPSRIVYITSHMDAISDTPSACAPGADDNGSGTAGVIEAARVLSQYQFNYTIKFACFNGEEQGLIGSAAYVADIAADGEDVIGDFNMDMIAYRGTDPAPPDLIVYTNSASQSLATTISNAVQDYLPGLLQSIVHVENITASDHASFWNHGYKAIVAIEDEAWGDDFCPWYHTCNDMIFRYPQDYALNCSRALTAALAITAVPLAPDGPYLVMEDTQVDDDAAGPSEGDGDGILNPGESVELWVTVKNVGTASAQNVSGLLASSSGSVAIVDGTGSWANIPAGATGTCTTPFVFSVSGSALDGEALDFTLDLTHALGFQELSFQFSVVAPDLAFRFHRLVDGSGGNGNGIIDLGETVQVPVSLFNAGGKAAVNVSAQLSSMSPYVTVIDGEGSSPNIGIGAAAELAPAYRIRVDAGAPQDAVLPFDLAISTAAGYEAASSFKLKVGTLFYDDAEADGAWALTAAGDNATNGIWVRVDPIGTLYNGSPAQSEDDHTAAPWTDCFVTGQGTAGGAAGDEDVDGGKTTLTTPSFDLSGVLEPRVTYWRWYTNNLGNNPAEDEWLVQVSADGGASWVDLERTTASANSWQQRSFLVEDYVTPSAGMVIRFVASDLINGSLVEGAVDDFEISGLAQPVTAVADLLPSGLRLAYAQPNPLRDRSLLSFALPAEGQVSLKLYSVDGRLVRTLIDGSAKAGSHELIWDGNNDTGRKVSPGVYFCRLAANGEERTRKLVVLH